MEAEVIRKQLHGYIDKADFRFINLVYAMMLADMADAEYEMIDDQKKVMNDRLEDYIKNPNAGSTLEEVFQRLRV